MISSPYLDLLESTMLNARYLEKEGSLVQDDPIIRLGPHDTA